MNNMFLYGTIFDPTMMILLPALIISLYAQAKVSSTFSKYQKVRNDRGYTGAEIAEMILRREGINDVRVERVRGNLTDHYDPTKKVLRLSDSVYGSTSVAAVGVAAHECGHAIQHARGYAFLKMRHAIFPLVSISSKLAMPLFFIGLFFAGFEPLIMVGIYLFAAVVLFQLVTLPVEFNASNRAIAVLENNNFLTKSELKPARKVLNAAALTYVASAVMAIAQLLRLLAIRDRRR